MAKKGKSRQSRARSNNRALNAFDIAEDDENQSFDELGENSDDNEYAKYMTGEVASDDDEDIDSDEALGSDDDWEEMLSKKKEKNSQKSDESDFDVGMDEDPEEYDNINSGELMSLSQIWDMDDKSKHQGSESDDSESDGDDESSNSEQSDNEDDLSEDSDNDDDIDEQKMSQLRKMIGHEEPKASRKRLEVNNTAENEYAMPSGAKKLSLAELTSSVSDSKGLNLIKGKQGVENKSQKLSVPLPRRIQERHDRSAAYELTKEEVDKWEDTVRQNREAEHLQFPINPAPAVQKITNYTPVEPSNDFEKKIDKVLKDSALADEKAISTFEDLAPAKLTKEELQKQLNERRLMRELALREEVKAKRIKKIKSKSYRRVHKKERMKEAELMGEESDEDDHNAKRARERMTLKHKNTGKWAKDMIGQGFTKDGETRAEMEEMLRRGQALREKVQGVEESDDEEIDDIGRSDDELDKIDKNKVGKGILGMKFMQDAAAADREYNQKLLDNDDDDIFEDDEVVENIGRRSFNPEAAAAKEEADEELEKVQEEVIEERERNLDNRLSKKSDRYSKRAEQLENQEENDEEESSNPWLSVENKRPLESSKTVKDEPKRGLRRKTNQKEKPAEQTIDMNQTLDLVDPLSDGKLMQFEQKDLVKRAFAGDDVVQEFQEAKRQRIEDEGDKEVDLTLPGWGGWDGAGLEDTNTAKKKKKFVKVVKGVKQDKRKDAKLKNVIINQKIDKKGSKFAADKVPYPFETREQYERSLQMPIGQEWTSRDTHQKLTKPRVMVKQGTVIDPLNRPFK